MKGKCSKCGEIKTVRQHHYKGYSIDETIPYCYSCDMKAHNKARKEGRCLISSNERSRISKISSIRRCQQNIKFGEPVCSNVYIYEQLTYNLHNGNVYVSSWFESPSNIQLIQENI